MSQADLYKQLAASRRSKKEETEEKPEVQPPQPQESKKRGRPATGKRSNPDWIGRTYYIRKETDLDVESELLKLKREGIELDKSELVDFLLGEWVKSRQGNKATFRNPKSKIQNRRGYFLRGRLLLESSRSTKWSCGSYWC
jgi:hypothetical protein